MPSPGLNVVVLLEKKNHRDFGSEVNFLILRQLKPRNDCEGKEMFGEWEDCLDEKVIKW